MCVIYCVKMKRLFLLCFIVCLGFSAGVLNGVSSAPDAVELIPLGWTCPGRKQGKDKEGNMMSLSFLVVLPVTETWIFFV